jgi:hypothetical protein
MWEVGVQNWVLWQRWIEWYIGWWYFFGFLDQYRLFYFLSALGNCGHPGYHNLAGLFQTGL